VFNGRNKALIGRRVLNQIIASSQGFERINWHALYWPFPEHGLE